MTVWWGVGNVVIYTSAIKNKILLCVQEVVTHLCSNLLYKIANYFLDIKYEVLSI